MSWATSPAGWRAACGGQRAKIIGVIVSDIQNPFFPALVRAVEDTAHQHGYVIFLCNTDEDLEKERLYIGLMQAEKVAGVVITATQETCDACKALVEAGIPVVSVDRRLPKLDVDTVVADNVAAAYALVLHLIQDGHRRIGAILGLIRPIRRDVSATRAMHRPCSVTTCRGRSGPGAYGQTGYSQWLSLRGVNCWICRRCSRPFSPATTC